MSKGVGHISIRLPRPRLLSPTAGETIPSVKQCINTSKGLLGISNACIEKSEGCATAADVTCTGHNLKNITF